MFAPGTSWAFSDTNFVLLGEIMTKASGMPYGKLIRSLVLDDVGMRGTRYTTTTAIPYPILHAYSNERGKYEETTFWTTSPFTYSATLTCQPRRHGSLRARPRGRLAAHRGVA